MIEETLAEAGEKMDKTIEAVKTEFAKVRTGRVNPAIFSSITADYYGAPTPLQQPWCRSTLKMPVRLRLFHLM